MELSKKINGKKYMWDGLEYVTKEEAEKKASEYAEKGFEVKIIEIKESEKKFYIYTRKVATVEEVKK